MRNNLGQVSFGFALTNMTQWKMQDGNEPSQLLIYDAVVLPRRHFVDIPDQIVLPLDRFYKGEISPVVVNGFHNHSSSKAKSLPFLLVPLFFRRHESSESRTCMSKYLCNAFLSIGAVAPYQRSILT